MATMLPAYQSSVLVHPAGTFPASLANDGNRSPSVTQLSCSHSLQETNPWWAVDLGLPLTVTGVFFTNRDSEGLHRHTHTSFVPLIPGEKYTDTTL